MTTKQTGGAAMDAAHRRKTITHILEEAKAPVSAAALAREYAVPNAFQPFQGAVEERLGHF